MLIYGLLYGNLVLLYMYCILQYTYVVYGYLLLLL